MKRILIACLFFVIFYLSSLSTSAQAQTSPATESAQIISKVPSAQQNNDFYARAKVIEIVQQGKKELFGTEYPFQVITLRILSGPEEGKEVEVRHGDSYLLKEDQFVRASDVVVLIKSGSGDKALYNVADKYRLPNVAYIALFFLVLVIFFARRKGLGAIIGLGISFVILMSYIVPRIVAGDNPLTVILIGSIGIVTITIFLAHGITKRAGIAYISTLITLLLAGIFAYSFILITRLSGLGSEEAYTLQTGAFGNLNFQGLLLGSIIIGVLGILDDITTSQSAVVDELKKANPQLSIGALYEKGLSVGQEHIASLVNTLILVYAGSAFPVLLAFTVINQYQPLWVTLNSQFIVEEIVRSLVGSVALILAVPITTLLASWYFGKKNRESEITKKSKKKKRVTRQ